MARELDHIEIPEEYEVLDTGALAKRLGFQRQTVSAYLVRGLYRKVPKPNRMLDVGPIWYLGAVQQWERGISDN